MEEDAYQIVGGTPLKGTIKVSGAKNVALKVIISALMFDGPVTLHNVPRIKDVTELIHLIRKLGVRAEFADRNTVEIDPSTLSQSTVDMLHATRIRASFMLFAPLLHKFKACRVPNPGGCRIGARSIDRIIEGMQALGISVTYDRGTGYYDAKLEGTVQGEYHFLKPTHTGTEMLLMLAVCGQNVKLHNVAQEPEVDELIRFLNEAGAAIKREGTSLTITGAASLKQTKPFSIVGDRNEAATFAVLGIASRGDVTVTGLPVQLLTTFTKKVEEAGGGVQIVNDVTTRFYYKGDLTASSVETAPHPGFMTDWQPNWAVLMTQATGESIIHERIFENRFAYAMELRKLGAKVDYTYPAIDNPQEYYHFKYDATKNYQQVIRITGPTKLHNAVLTINDLRAGACLAIAALIAEGESVVQNASILERGYENFVEKVTSIGGSITKI
jgi:UDP-N-acetylglucosamine 1-carboxyvinyltransferase